jgi:hypothetical protein
LRKHGGLGGRGDRTTCDAESKRYTTPTSVKCERNIRGDKTAIELFVAGVRGWQAGLRRLDNGKPVGHVPERFTMWDTRSASATAMSPTPPGAIEVRASVDRLVRKQHS